MKVLVLLSFLKRQRIEWLESKGEQPLLYVILVSKMLMRIVVTRYEKMDCFPENRPWDVTVSTSVHGLSSQSASMKRRHSGALHRWGVMLARKTKRGSCSVHVTLGAWRTSSTQVSRFELCWSNLQKNQHTHPRNLHPFPFVGSCYVEATKVH